MTTKHIFMLILICQYFYSFGQNIAKKDVIEDFVFMNKAFSNGHPLNLVTGRKTDFSTDIENLNQQLPDSISQINVENKVQEFLFQLGCIHTALQPSVTNRKRFFPFHIFSDGNKLWIQNSVNDTFQTSIKKGNELIAINQKSAKEIIKTIKHYHPVDGQSDAFGINLLNKAFPYYFYRCVDRSSSFVVQYRNHDGVIQTETLQSMEEYQSIVSLPKNKMALIQGHNESFSLLNDSIGLISITSFHRKNKAFYNHVFDYIKAHRVQYLIIDVRDNLGGSRSNASRLISYLTKEKCKFETIRPKKNLLPYLKGKEKMKFLFSYLYYDIGHLFSRSKSKQGVVIKTKILPKKNRYSGKIYTLVNGFTGSSASLLATYLKHHANSVIIGQQTGGGEFSNNGGSYPYLILPNTKLKIQTGTYLMQYDIKGDNPNGIIPDYITHYTVDTYNKKDVEVEKALEIIGLK